MREEDPENDEIPLDDLLDVELASLSILERDPDDIEALKDLVDALTRQGRLDDALPHMVRLKYLCSDDAETMLVLAKNYAQLGLIEEASEFFEAFLTNVDERDMAPDDVLDTCGEFYWMVGNYEKAIESFQQYLEMHPDDHKTLVALGNLSRDLKRYEQAIGYFERYAYLNPDNTDTIAECADIYADMGNLERAIELQSLYCDLSPDSPTAWSDLGTFYAESGDDELAAYYYEKAMEILPWHIRARCNLASYYIDNDKCEGAIALLDVHIERLLELDDDRPIDPDMSELWHLKGRALIRTEQTYLAMLNYEEAVEIFGEATSPSLWASYSECLSLEGREDEAKVAIEKALAVVPYDIDFILSYAELLANQGEFEKAHEMVDQAQAELDKSLAEEGNAAWTPDVFWARAQIFHEQGEHEKALYAARQAKAVTAIIIDMNKKPSFVEDTQMLLKDVDSFIRSLDGRGDGEGWDPDDPDNQPWSPDGSDNDGFGHLAFS